MQDGAPCQTTKLIIEFLVQKNFKFLPWPECSPELNPIESIWELVRR